MMLKRFALYLLLLIAFPLNGQQDNHKDTVLINEVVIDANRFLNRSTAGFKTLEIEKRYIKDFSASSLSEMLSSISPLFIKDYGAGGIATPSFRGTDASHTILLWNDININHPMVGQSDFSIIFPALINKVSVNPGSASMISGSGGFGGSVSLKNSPEWGKGSGIELSPGTGSFGTRSGFLCATISKNNFSSVTKAFLNNADNDFKFLNNYSGSTPSVETRINGQIWIRGIMQEVYVRQNSNILSARVWYQSSLRNLALPVISWQAVSNEKQSDESFRSMVDYTIRNSDNELSITGAWIRDRLDYSNLLASVDSRNLADKFVIKGGFSGKLSERTSFKLNLNDELCTVNSNNYSDRVFRNNASITVIAERREVRRIRTTLLLREIIDGRKFLLPDFTAGIEYRLLSGADHFLYSNISGNSKIASLNDLFWYPGGNPDLKNEHAFSYEGGYHLNLKSSLPISVTTDISVFASHIRDMIQWHPGEYTYWIAGNLKSINTCGAEAYTGLEYSLRKLNLSANAGYSYTRSVNAGLEAGNLKGKRIIYIPENQINSLVSAKYGKFHSSWISIYTGRRYTTADNSEYLPGYYINNLLCGFSMKLRFVSADIDFGVHNLFNVAYQSIAYYPQPGRSFHVNIRLQYEK